MKVNDLKTGYTYSSRPSGTMHIDKNGLEGAFSQAFSNAADRSIKERLGNMLLDIQGQGQKLQKSTGLVELLHYKRIIVDFLNAVTSSMLHFSTSETVDKRGRRKKYVIIKMVDERLELITEQVMKNEMDHIALLKLIGEIEGLLVDLIA